MLHSACRGLTGGRSDLGRAPFRDNDAAGARTFGHTGDRAKVARVLDLVEDDYEGVLRLEQLVCVRVGVVADLRTDALVVLGATALGDLERIGLLGIRPLLGLDRPDLL